MKRTTFTIMTPDNMFIDKLRAEKLIVAQTGQFTYVSQVPVYLETRLEDLIEDTAKKTKASVTVYIHCPMESEADETSDGWIYIHEGKIL